MNKISGYTCVRNGISLDYCFDLTIQSLLPVCDEVVVCDSDSDDGTRARLDAMAIYDHKVKVINRPWPNPHREINWWLDWINWTRGHLSHPVQLMLDADEVLDPASYETVRTMANDGACGSFERLNFYGGADRVASEGWVCGHYVARLGPRQYFMPSDEPHFEGEPEIRQKAAKHPTLRIFHYGFLRKPEAFYRKSKVVMNGFFGREDPRVVKCAADGVKNWADVIPVPTTKFEGEHPAIALDWLRERGWL